MEKDTEAERVRERAREREREGERERGPERKIYIYTQSADSTVSSFVDS